MIFIVDNSSFFHIDNKKKDILILDEDPTQGLDDITITAEANYPINFTESRERFVLSLYYNETNRILLVNDAKFVNSKQKALKLNHIYCAQVIFRKILQLIT